MSDKVTAGGGQAAGRDISNSPLGDVGTVGVIGNGASGNVFIQNLHIHGNGRGVRPPQLTIPDGSICEAQAARLKDLVNEWVVTHNQIKPRSPLTHQAAWLKLNRRIKVATYRATPDSAFSGQEKWLLQQAAILRSAASAPRRDESWRADKIKAIKTRSSRAFGDSDFYKPYIIKNFKLSSLTELSNTDLQKTYTYVFSKKVQPGRE